MLLNWRSAAWPVASILGHDCALLEPLPEPTVDCLLWFENGENDILTSRLSAITRPPRKVVQTYAA